MIKLCLIVPIPFIVGLILDFVGYRTGNIALAQAGIKIMTFGSPLVMFAAVVISLVMIITGRWSLSDDKKSDGPEADGNASAAETESSKIEDINNSYGYESQMKTAQFQAEHTANNYRQADRSEKIKGWLLFGFLMTDFALILVFGLLGIMVGAIVCFSLFVGTILICLIVKLILEKTSMSKKIDYNKYEQKSATVRACVFSSMGSTGGAGRNSTVRVRSVTYRIILDVEGKEYNAYSSVPYDEGGSVIVAVKKNGGRQAKIIAENGGKELG